MRFTRRRRRDRLPLADDEIERLEQLALEFVEHLGPAPVPTDVDRLAEQAGFNIVEGAVPEHLSRVLRLQEPRDQRLVGSLDWNARTIYIASRLSEARRRFTIAHELGHAVLEPHRALHGRPLLWPSRRERLEHEANYFAAALIFHGNRFSTEAGDGPVAASVPLGLAERWGVSPGAALRRYVERHGRPCALAIFATRFDGEPDLVLRAAYESTSFHRKLGRIDRMLPDSGRGHIETAALRKMSDSGTELSSTTTVARSGRREADVAVEVVTMGVERVLALFPDPSGFPTR